MLAERPLCPGALAPSYDVPLASFSRGRAVPLAVLASLLAAAALAWRHGGYVWSHPAYRPVLSVLLAGSALVAVQWLLALRDEPSRAAVPPGLRVTVSIPVYNEAPAILDRALWSAVNQTRPPQRVHVVDDGSAGGYEALRLHWEGWHGQVEVLWTRQENQGKKAAQAAAVLADRAADIFVTVDSDSSLECRAIENGLRPFADPRVTSVAGMVLVANQKVSWLTRTTNSRTLLFQVLACGAQSSLGQVLVNRGPLAFYRARVLRPVMGAYTGERFLGRAITLGDDAALTLFAQLEGRTVQQSDSFAFSEYPETLSHHLRQWTRWMRGSTVRNCWRIRYLPVWSYGWWFTLVNLYLWMMSLAVPLGAALSWPRSARLVLWLCGSVVPWGCGSVVPWGCVTGLRVLSARRSDETGLDRLVSVLICPASTVWGLLVLRWVRVWGIATWWKQGWNTRQDGAEQLSASLQEARA